MFNWVSLELYTPVYYYLMLVVVFWVLLKNSAVTTLNSGHTKTFQTAGVVLLLFVVLYMGLRPVSGRFFGDMSTYANIYSSYALGFPVLSDKDVLFHLFMYYSAQFISVELFFLLCAGLYVIPLYLVCKKWFPNYWFFAFLMLVTAFSFWAAGTNGIRNGIAGSLFLLGISRDKRIFQALWLLASLNIHLSMLLPVVLWVLLQFYNKPKLWIGVWVVSIPLSLLFAGFWEGFFGAFDLNDERLRYFSDTPDEEQFRAVGFRWDFLIYSAVGVAAGAFYILKLKFDDKIYNILFGLYVLANAFWILVINANFSNRFAYLSWFMMALIIIYPLLKQHLTENQHKKIGFIVFIHFLFTFLMVNL